MAKVDKINMIPQTDKFWVVFREVSGYMTSEFFADKETMEKHIFKLEYEGQKYRLIQATSLNVKVKLEYDFTKVTREFTLNSSVYEDDKNGKHF